MMNKHLATLLVATCCLVSGTLAVQAGEYLSAEEVRNVVTGKSANGIHLKKDFAYRIYFAPDGALHQIKEDGSERNGRWQVNDNGKHCIKWSDMNRRKCFQVRDNGDGSYTKVKVKGRKVIEILRWSDFQDGNALN